MARAKGLATYPLPPTGSFGEACEAAANQLLADVLAFHAYVIHHYGGSPSILQPELLVAAVYRPFTVIGDTFAYSTGLEQTAALLHSLVKNHPFEDGNKRTALMACLYFLQRCGFWRDVIFLSELELTSFEALALSLATERADIAQGELAAPRSIAELADQIRRIIQPSRNRRPRPSRLVSGTYYLLADLFTSRD